jgi:hypothetical protein
VIYEALRPSRPRQSRMRQTLHICGDSVCAASHVLHAPGSGHWGLLAPSREDGAAAQDEVQLTRDGMETGAMQHMDGSRGFWRQQAAQKRTRRG